MGLKERIENLVKMKSINDISPRAFKRLMKEMAEDTKKSAREIELLFTEELNKLHMETKKREVMHA